FVLTNLIIKRISDFKRGDVVVFNAPTDPDKDFIKRIIGVPGDSVMVQNGKVYVNGKIIDEKEYLAPSVQTSTGAFLHESEAVTVQQGNYFVMGDNRPESSDSREWGFVPREKIIGKSFFVYWPVSEAMLIRNPY
ncbi:MAG: signal peptidase I, partial [Candidatus Levybacteria bacterium]|nr:signal peptidase I [Candidatus Levybacteria bacterium]